MKKSVDVQKRFLMYWMYPKYLAAPHLVAAKSTKALTSLPPCRVCGHSCASLGTPRRWSLSLDGLHTAPFVGLCSALFPAIDHGGPSSPPGLAPEVIPCRRSARVYSP